MQLRDLPIIFLVLAFAGLLFILSQIHQYTPVVSVEPVPDPETQQSFTGRVVMPSLDDIYVLENSSGRDLLQFERFLQGRAAGLHFASSSYFKSHRSRKGKQESGNVMMGIRLTLDSLGVFTPEILFSNTDDKDFQGLVLSQIQAYWRYPRSEEGRLVVWVPVVWKDR